MTHDIDPSLDAMQLAELERLQMSCELHDGVLQYLIAARMLVEAIELSSSTEDHRLTALREMLERGIREGREWIGRLRGDEQQSQPFLSQSLQSLCERYTGSFQEGGTRFEFLIDDKLDSREWSDRVRLAIFRIAQESLQNAKLHARATMVTLSATFSNHEVRLTVSDNGKGFDVENLPKDHYGILGMRARARMTGGNLEIRSSTKVGTTIEAAWIVG